VSRGRGPALLATLAFLPVLPVPVGAQSGAELVRHLQSRGIQSERVLEAFGRVRRAAFLPPAARARAGADVPLDIGHGQTTSEPYVMALMTEQLGLDGRERVLEVGTGSGYYTAILATLAHEIYSVEIVPELATAARLRLAREGYRNVHVKEGDGTLGWREYGPYDAVVVAAAAPRVPRALIDQLRDGGVLVMPIGEPDGRQVLIRGVKRGMKLHAREVAEVRFVPLLHGVPEDARGGAAAPRLDAERRGARPAPELNEEELPEDDPGPRSDTRPLRAGRIRAARAPGARGSDRRCAAGGARRAGGGSPPAIRRCAA
jgi:protein-L-isoaspartate(D-aspartate) O-methyltransferase